MFPRLTPSILTANGHEFKQEILHPKSKVRSAQKVLKVIFFEFENKQDQITSIVGLVKNKIRT